MGTPAGRAYIPAVAAPFPSLVITKDALVPRGAFAEAQAEFLSPDPAAVTRLRALLEDKNAGVVAHFYMDPELQGVLTACAPPTFTSPTRCHGRRGHPHGRSGHASTSWCSGVDFMSENVRAMLDAAGHANVAVYRVASDPIGCSLAASAEARAYVA